MMLGNRWSIVFKLNAIVYILMAASNSLMVVGAWNVYARALAGCTGCLLACANLAAIIVTGVFRFNTAGQLSALSLTPSKYNPDAYVDPDHEIMPQGYLSDDRTFNSDAAVIMGLFIGQCVYCCFNCCLGAFMGKPQASAAHAPPTPQGDEATKMLQ